MLQLHRQPFIPPALFNVCCSVVHQTDPAIRILPQAGLDLYLRAVPCGVSKYYIGPIGDLSLLTATAAAARVQFALSH